MEAILAHELCHVRRRDNLTATSQMAVQAVFWFHPLVWWLGALGGCRQRKWMRSIHPSAWRCRRDVKSRVPEVPQSVRKLAGEPCSGEIPIALQGSYRDVQS